MISALPLFNWLAVAVVELSGLWSIRACDQTMRFTEF